LREGKDFFIWISCNPLKSLESAKGIQGNPSLFPWISLVLFGFAWTPVRAGDPMPVYPSARRT
jgi:hypothetical protein